MDCQGMFEKVYSSHILKLGNFYLDRGDGSNTIDLDLRESCVQALMSPLG